jgi:hypothetical protein
VYQPQPYAVETQADGTQIIYTNQEDATLRYSALITDTTQFSPLFVASLSYLLASYLAGPTIKAIPTAIPNLPISDAFSDSV